MNLAQKGRKPFKIQLHYFSTYGDMSLYLETTPMAEHLPVGTGGGFETIPPDKRSDKDVRKTMSLPAIRAFFNVADRWELLVEERRGLLGWPGASTYHKYRQGAKTGDIPALTYDALIRISLVLGMFKALHILYSEQSLADRWIKLPNKNPIFAGSSPLAFMMASGIDGMYQVRRLLDARRGGWN
jgi:hypothetical protein